MTEVNFFKPQEKATFLIDSVISRWNSRYKKSYNLFSSIILDSSDTEADSAVPTFLKENPWGRETKQFKYSIWEAKPSQYWHKPDKNRIDDKEFLYTSNGERIPNENFGKPSLSFRVYCGDAEIHPFIVESHQTETKLFETSKKLDPDRFVDIPNDLRNLFEGNIELAIQETCGRYIESTGKYFNSDLVLPMFDIENQVHYPGEVNSEDIICCSFFDEHDTYIQYIQDAIELIPKGSSVFTHIDNGLVDDRLGICFGYVYDVGRKNDDGVISYDPEYKIPIILGISRLPGEETNIRKIMDLIKWVHTQRPIYRVSSDTFQNVQFKQDCLTLGINYKVISLDRSTTGYKLTKDALYRKKLHLSKNELTKNEILNVYFDEAKQKVDHHEKLNANGDIGSNSKDTLDAVCGCVQSMYEAISEDIDGVMNPEISSDSMWQEYNENFVNELTKGMMIRKFKTKLGKHYTSRKF